ncbi:hypothetical protein AAFF_G00420200 [Aldrovandia affinis]|uniref:Uncharacterized protein n=1 Tax=Aldrovandia affinis TaxID=143900 RepID=A0AAD7SAK4_9TELE|nr:hypothetical protein AAFF_G00420200 [Aldrovandia affinis]
MPDAGCRCCDPKRSRPGAEDTPKPPEEGAQRRSLNRDPQTQPSATVSQGRQESVEPGIYGGHAPSCSSPAAYCPSRFNLNTDNKPIDREPLVYHMDAGVCHHGNSEDLPEDFFEVTVNDIKKRYTQLQSEW